MGISLFVVVLALIGGLAYLVEALFAAKHDPREPPRMASTIPLIGHLVGMIQFGASYLSQVSFKQSSSIFTVPIFSLKLYIVNSTALITAVQRASKTLSFSPFQKWAAANFAGISEDTLKVYDIAGERQDEQNFLRDLDRSARNSLLPGPDLDRMNVQTAIEIQKFVDGVEGMSGKPTALYGWVQDTVTMASTIGVYGPLNPYLEPSMQHAYWAYDKGLPRFLMGFAPKLIASEATRARDIATAAFEEYYQRKGHEQASTLVQDRWRVYQEYRVKLNDIARLEVAMGIAILSNSVPTAFWTIYQIFSRPALLADLRDELSTVTTRTADGHFTFDVATLKTHGKLLLSVFQEMQRTRTVHANIRKVIEDTTLENRYLLKKGQYLQVPAPSIHHDTSLWGPKAGEFDPHRFVDGQSKVAPHSFLAWGIAPHLCPARQFASTEILILVALLILRVDVVPAEGGWTESELMSERLTAVLPPKKDITVLFTPREGWQGRWTVNMGESKSRFPLASG